MPNLVRLSVCALMLLSASAYGVAPPSQPAGLAQAIPGDARIFLELRDLDAVLASPAGTALQALVRPLITATTTTQPATSGPAAAPASREAPPSRPASAPAIASASAPTPTTTPATTKAASTSRRSLFAWRQKLAAAMGIRGDDTAEVLLSGRLVFAADGWRSLADAVLVAEPKDLAALEADLAPLRTAGSPDSRVRIYSLGQGHELACDGHFAVVGRAVNPAGLYRRTLALWSSDAGVSLSEVAEFRERWSALPSGAQAAMYINFGGRSVGSRPATEPADAIGLGCRSWAASLLVTADGITLEADARLRMPMPQTQPASASVALLSRVPASTLVGWTQHVDFAKEFGNLSAGPRSGLLRMYVGVLQAGLPAGAFESMLSHLVGDTVFIVGQTEAPGAPPQAASSRPASGPASTPASLPAPPRLVLPTMVMLVKTDAPEQVERTLKPMSVNLVRLLNIERLPDGPLSLQDVSDGGSGTVHTIDVGRLLASHSRCEFLRSLALSWTVADGWLVIGSHVDAVRQLVRARRGGPDSMPIQPASDAASWAQQGGGTPSMLLVAQPRAAGDMLRSWMKYVAVMHPEMLRSAWWQDLMQRQMTSGVQLGILSARTTQPAVEVAQAVPGWPAYGRLKPGDRIVGVNGQPLDPRDPEGSLRLLIAGRGPTSRVLLTIHRDGREQQIELVMPPPPLPVAPDVRPLELLRDAGNLLRAFSSASYAEWRRSPVVVHARLELRFAP